ncbi:MAG: TIGR03668 family PPOX class F420-dependent oxidoreductase [Actinomycetota bacterium]
MPTIETERARAVLSRPETRVGRLGTVTDDGRPHLVPCCFAVTGDAIVSVVDGKPKSSTQLRRLDNIAANPSASLLVDHYDDDWSTLWWIRADGEAEVVEPGGDGYASAVDALAAKYPQYRADRPTGPLVVIHMERVTGWSAGDRP